MKNLYSSIIKKQNPNMQVYRTQRNITSLIEDKSHDFEIKPKILESRFSQNADFLKMSDGFQRIFSDDKKDKKMIIPIAGYGGHRRGDRSQNFFGKSFRESSLQSKKLERDLRCQTAGL